MEICKLKKTDNLSGEIYGEYPVNFDGEKIFTRIDGRYFEQKTGVNSCHPLDVVPMLVRNIEWRLAYEGQCGWFLAWK